MKFDVPWSVKGIRPEAREQAREAARRSGVSLGEWLNAVIVQQAEEEGVQAHSHIEEDDDEIASVNQRLDDLSRRIEKIGRTGPEAYAPTKSRNEPDQLAELIQRLDKRLDQFSNVARAVAQLPQQPMQLAVPSVQLPPSLDRAVAEIAARKRILNGNAPAAPVPTPPQYQTHGNLAMAVPAMAASAPLPQQDLSGLEDQLRTITNQIETLRNPGVEEAINALREELGEIGRALGEAMPRRAIDAIERQIQGLNQRIAEGRQAGVDGNALGNIEHGLAEVRDALRGLTPAESLVGFNEAVAGLAHKIDLVVAEKDPTTMAQLENAITTLREMSSHIADNETVRILAEQVYALGEKVEHMAHVGTGGGALDHLEQRIGALSDAIAEHAQAGGGVPPRLEALVESLSDKIEQIQHSRGNGEAFGHLEDRIVKLVEKLDASDSRLGHLEAIERGLADLLIHIEKANKSGGLRAEGAPDVDDLKQNLARTQDSLEAVHGTLGHVVDRLAMIEKDIRGEGRRAPEPRAPVQAPPAQVPVRVAARALSDAPPLAPAAAQPPPPAAQLPIDPDLPPDQPLEPGSGPPPLQANPAARIAASEAALGGARPAAPAGKSNFIAAARRAAQAASQEPAGRAPRPEQFEDFEPEQPSLRAKLTKRIKGIFVAASVVAIIVGSIEIIGNVLDLGGEPSKTAQAPGPQRDRIETTANTPAPALQPAQTLAANPLALPQLPAAPLASAPQTQTDAVPPVAYNSVPAIPSLLNPPMLTPADATGSISRTTRPAAPAAQPSQTQGGLPNAIGGPTLRNAAMAGDAAAAYEIAVRYAEGRGVPTDLEEAARWYERAASKGLVPAQFRYASMLEKGQGVRKDLAQARKLYLAAAGKGNGKSMHNLAVLYAEGIDGRPDYATAAQWFRKASQRGIADSQYNLGVLCARGLGTPRDHREAYKWFALAAAQGDNESARKRDEIGSHMDPGTLANAQATVKSFVPELQPDEAMVVAQPPGGWDNAAGTTLPPRKRPNAPMSLGSLH
jgi:localization factor PodJL